MGSYKNPKICDIDNLRRVSKLLQNVTILCGDYTCVEQYIDESTFVYFDPPYRPLTKTAEFTSYNADMFDDNAQVRLAEFIKSLGKQKLWQATPTLKMLIKMTTSLMTCMQDLIFIE